MEEKKAPPRKRVWKLRASPVSLTVLVLVLVLVGSAAVGLLYLVRQEIQARTEEIRQDVAALEYANENLEEKKANPNSAENIRDIAREELGLVDPNAVVIQPETDVTQATQLP